MAHAVVIEYRTSVIVNRGWLPKDEMEKHMALTTSRPPQVEVAPATVQLVGVLVQGEEVRHSLPSLEGIRLDQRKHRLG